MAAKKQPAKAKKASAPKKEAKQTTAEKHPYETDSQVQNRYGKGRQQNGSDSGRADSVGDNH